jgi:hypothetical protein
MIVLRSQKVIIIASVIYLTAVGSLSALAINAAKTRREAIQNSPTVYITRIGKKYHTEEHYGQPRSRPISLYEAVEQGYEACLVCEPPTMQVSLVPAYYRRWYLVVGALTLLFAGSVVRIKAKATSQ